MPDTLDHLRSHSPPPAVRALLVVEVLAYVALFSAHVWIIRPWASAAGVPWLKAAVPVLLFVLPILLNLLHGDCASDSGLRVDNFKASLRLMLPATAILAAGAMAAGFYLHGWEWISFTRFFERFGIYIAWGFYQQYLLQAFSLRRLRQALVPPAGAVILAAGLFAMLHAPNWMLAGGSFVSGVVWCAIFLRVPNILSLGIGHAMLGVLVYHAWYYPAKALSIGPAFLK